MKYSQELESASFFSTYQVYYNNCNIDCEAIVYINSIFRYFQATPWQETSPNVFTTRLIIDQQAGVYEQKITKKYFSQLLTDRPATAPGTKLIIKVQTALEGVNEPCEEDETIIIVEDPDPSEG